MLKARNLIWFAPLAVVDVGANTSGQKPVYKAAVQCRLAQYGGLSQCPEVVCPSWRTAPTRPAFLPLAVGQGLARPDFPCLPTSGKFIALSAQRQRRRLSGTFSSHIGAGHRQRTRSTPTVWDDICRDPQIDLLKGRAQGPSVNVIAGAQIKLRKAVMVIDEMRVQSAFTTGTDCLTTRWMRPCATKACAAPFLHQRSHGCCITARSAGQCAVPCPSR